tara:strand:+ start:2652 stop:3599 length:948 start_codon:yes stop_codon:yes gene_type:complete
MLFRLFSLSSVFVSLFFLGACSDAPSKPTAAVKRDVTVAKAVLKTSGILRFDGLPGESISAAEVLVVSVLSDVARERILRQRELFENKITGRVEDLAGVSSIEGMSPVDAMKLEASLGALRSQFPSVRVEDVDLGNNRLRKYQSDVALFKEYEYLFASIEWDNVERGLEFIADKMTADSKALVARSSGMDDDALQQSDVTLDWLRAVQQHYNSYVVLAQESVEAKNRYLHAQAAVASTPAEPTDWDGYVAWHAHNLIMDISENLLGTAFAEEDGSFEVEGQGIVIVRVQLGVVSAYFLPGSEHEKRVLVEDLQQF